MTVSINGRPDVLTTSEVWAFCRAYNELGLKTDQIGAVYVGDQPDPVLLAKEVRTIMRVRADLADACNRILEAIGSTANGSSDKPRRVEAARSRARSSKRRPRQ